MVDGRPLMRGLFRLMLRLALWLMGLVFLFSLLMVGLLLLGYWLLKALWCKLCGRPLPPLVWRFVRPPSWSVFGNSRQERYAAHSEVIDVTARTIEDNRR